MKKNRAFQICVIAYLVIFFISLDSLIYFRYTRRLENHFGKEMETSSINLSEYQPFTEDSKIVRLSVPDEKKFHDGDFLPVLDGATALFPVYSAVFNSLYPEGSCIFDGETFSEKSKLQKRNTAGAFKALNSGDADIIFCANPSKKQLEAVKEAGLELSLIPIGFEAFVFLVNAKNPVDSLTQKQIKSIYTGKVSKWSEVGGDGSYISALVRPEGSGSQTAMLAFMGDEKIAVKNHPYKGRSLGYSFRFYVQGIVGSQNIKLLKIDGVYPDKENIRNGSYPIVSNFYAITRAEDRDNASVKKVIDFLLSPEGQNLIEESGYVKLGD
ncbi:MAG: substrate-binding domain-containing protein [Treponema sp.]|nr:substrate-binding domain-containing protein [Treponema sp.]